MIPSCFNKHDDPSPPPLGKGRSLTPLHLSWFFFLFFASLFISCDSHTVEQIDVEVPAGVKVPADMVFIPSGEFIMGHPEDAKTAGGRAVALEAYLIDRHEVTRERYHEFRPEYAFHPKQARFPVALVTYDGAESYCKWKGRRLPTEAEWEKAARGVDRRKWPWRIFFQHPNNGFSGFLPEIVDKRDEWISPYGLFGMGYNVWEWTSDWYSYNGQQEAEKDRFKVIRGGVIQTHLTIKFSPVYFRNYMEPDGSFNFIGFRCAGTVG